LGVEDVANPAGAAEQVVKIQKGDRESAGIIGAVSSYGEEDRG
jgi:hypothetical protein